MLIAPTSKKEKVMQPQPVILQADTAPPADAVPAPPEAAPEVTITTTDTIIESNLGQTTQDNFEDATTRANKLAGLYEKLNTQWTTLKTEYENNRDLLIAEQAKYDDKHKAIWEERQFKFDQNHTCAISDLSASQKQKVYIRVLPSAGLDPISECVASSQCVGYDKNGTKIYQFAETCEVATDGSADIATVNFNYHSEQVYGALKDVEDQKPIKGEAEKQYNAQQAELDKLKKLEAYQEANQQTDKDVTMALNERQEGFRTRQQLYNTQLQQNKAQFTEYSNVMATAMESNVKDQATFREKLAAEKAILALATDKSTEFNANADALIGNVGGLATEIEAFMATEKIPKSDLAFAIASFDELQAVNNLQTIEEDWNEFSRLKAQHETNVEDLQKKIAEMEKTIAGQTVDMEDIRAKIWGTLGPDGVVDPSTPAAYVNAQVYANNFSLPGGPSRCTLRLGGNGINPGKCSVELTDSTGATIKLDEGDVLKNTQYTVDSKIVLKKGGKVIADDTQSDCIVVIKAGNNEYFAGNTDFTELNRYMPLQVTFDKETTRPLWENATDSIRVFSASQNDIHAKALTAEMRQVLEECKTNNNCSQEAERLCLEQGSQCVGVFKSGNNYGLLSTGSNDYYKSINRPDVSNCFAEGDDAKANDSDQVGITAKMKSHFTEYLEFSEMMARSNIMQTKAAAMKNAIQNRNTDWANAQNATEALRIKQEGLTATAEETFTKELEKLESLSSALTTSHNEYMMSYRTDAGEFSGIAAKRDTFEGKHNGFKENIKHVFNHPVWNTFMELQANQG